MAQASRTSSSSTNSEKTAFDNVGTVGLPPGAGISCDSRCRKSSVRLNSSLRLAATDTWRPNWFNSPSSWRPSKLLVACGRVTLSGAGSEGAAGASSAGFGFAGSATGFCGSEGAEGLTLPNSRVLFDLDLRQLCFAFMIFPPKIVSISLKPCADGVGEEDERLELMVFNECRLQAAISVPGLPGINDSRAWFSFCSTRDIQALRRSCPSITSWHISLMGRMCPS
mmetsp:Transcript_114188/g.271810  ORF Transcript_114188/g.271810 Transcript_114188/m.271810 type:complete len:225 (-) Transcript_114188:227-901(-)